MLVDGLGQRRTVRAGGGHANVAGGITADAAAGVGGRDEFFDAMVGVAGAAGLVDGPVNVEGDLVSETKTGNFGGGLDAAAAGDDRAAGGEFERGAVMRDGVGEGEGELVVEADGARRDVHFLEGAAQDRERVFVLVPLIGKGRFLLGEVREQFGEVVALERGADDEGRGGLRKDVGEEALRLVPVRAGEVIQRGAGGEEDGVDAVGLHELAGAVVTGGEFLFGDGVDVGAAVAKGEDGGGEDGRFGWRWALWPLGVQGESGDCGSCGEDKAAAREHGEIVWGAIAVLGAT